MKKIAQKHEINENDALSREQYEATPEFKFQSTINLLFAAVGTVFPHVKNAAMSLSDEKDPFKEVLNNARIRVEPRYNYFEFCEPGNNYSSPRPVLYFYLRPKDNISISQKIKRLSDYGTPFEDAEDDN